MRTVNASSFSALAIQLTLLRYITLLAGSSIQLKVWTTSSASKSLPSWNFTPCRRSKSSVTGSTQRQAVARLGLYSNVSGSRSTSRSHTWCETLIASGTVVKYTSSSGASFCQTTRSSSCALSA